MRSWIVVALGVSSLLGMGAANAADQSRANVELGYGRYFSNACRCDEVATSINVMMFKGTYELGATNFYATGSYRRADYNQGPFRVGSDPIIDETSLKDLGLGYAHPFTPALDGIVELAWVQSNYSYSFYGEDRTYYIDQTQDGRRYSLGARYAPNEHVALKALTNRFDVEDFWGKRIHKRSVSASVAVNLREHVWLTFAGERALAEPSFAYFNEAGLPGFLTGGGSLYSLGMRFDF